MIGLINLAALFSFSETSLEVTWLCAWDIFLAETLILS